MRCACALECHLLARTSPHQIGCRPPCVCLTDSRGQAPPRIVKGLGIEPGRTQPTTESLRHALGDSRRSRATQYRLQRGRSSVLPVTFAFGHVACAERVSCDLAFALCVVVVRLELGVRRGCGSSSSYLGGAPCARLRCASLVSDGRSAPKLRCSCGGLVYLTAGAWLARAATANVPGAIRCERTVFGFLALC